MKGHQRLPPDALYSPDGLYILTISHDDDNAVKVWDATSGKKVHTFSEHQGPVTSTHFSPAGDRVITTSRDTKIWDIKTGKVFMTLNVGAPAFASAWYHPDENRIVTGTSGSLKLWDAQSGELQFILTDRKTNFARSRFSLDGNNLIVLNPITILRAAPWRLEDLPGDESLSWKERFKLWKHDRFYKKWRKNND